MIATSFLYLLCFLYPLYFIFAAQSFAIMPKPERFQPDTRPKHDPLAHRTQRGAIRPQAIDLITLATTHSPLGAGSFYPKHEITVAEGQLIENKATLLFLPDTKTHFSQVAIHESPNHS